MRYIAICEGTRYPIYSSSEIKEEAVSTLWSLVHNYLAKANAPETQSMSAAELEEYFGYLLIDTLEKPSGFLHN